MLSVTKGRQIFEINGHDNRKSALKMVKEGLSEHFC